ncbi:MAG: hypothetical protein JSU63_16830 [Phycisphaerales bacterium]|nr:MAG: hypothetical protein JSU63_16830 [Phycisphaerales bacterium]
MSKRIQSLFILSAIVWAWPVAGIGQPSQSAETPQPRESEAPVEADDTLPDISVEEAVRIAVEAVNAFDLMMDTESASAAFQKATRATDVLQRLDPVNPWLYYLRGRVYAIAGRGNEAVEQLREFTRTRAGRNEWRGHRALADLFVEHYPRLAQASYESAYELKRNEPTVLMGLSECAFAVGEIDKAVRFATDAAEYDGHKSVRYEHHLATMLAARRDWPGAQRMALRSLEIARDSVQVGKDAHLALEVVGAQYELLIDVLKKRVQQTPDDARAHLDLAKYIREQSDHDVLMSQHEILKILEAGVLSTAGRTPAELAVQYAVAMAKVGRTEEAVTHLEKILSAEPNNAEAKEWLTRLRSE